MNPDVDEARAAWERALEELDAVDDAGRSDAEVRAAEALEALSQAIERAARERVPLVPTRPPDVLPELRAPVGPTSIGRRRARR
jgi:hypothetical protein